MDKADFYRRADPDRTGPLAGIRVLEAATTWAGPMCASLLGDFGAEVIKVELPGGEVARRLPPFLPDLKRNVSFAHATVNRNKRSLTLDLRRPEGVEIFLQLARRSDVLVENFRTGTLASWGVGYEDVRAVKPDIIYVSITGFGQFGPLAQRVGYDPLAQAAAGYVALNGERDGQPVKSATWLADDLGGLHAALGALAALAHRHQTGEGQHVDISLLDSVLAASNGYLTLGAMGAPMPRMGNEYLFAAPANAYLCRDGHVYAAVLLDSHWKLLAEAIGREELADDPRFATTPDRVRRRDELNQLMSDWCAQQTVAGVVDRFAAAGIPAAPVRSYAEAATDPHVLERDMLQPVAQEEGTVAPVTGPAAKFSRTPTKVRSGAPRLGADTDAILEALGISEDERRKLREQSVI